MPYGLVIMRWNIKSGAELVTKYPENIIIAKKVMLRVYDIHEHTSKEGITAFTDDTANIISYYSGPKIGLYIILLLTILDDPDEYEEKLAEIAKIIISSENKNQFLRFLPKLWQKISDDKKNHLNESV